MIRPPPKSTPFPYPPPFRPAQRGNLQKADALLTDATARLPAGTSPRARLRFLHAHGRIKDESGRLEDAARLLHEALALADQRSEEHTSELQSQSNLVCRLLL